MLKEERKQKEKMREMVDVKRGEEEYNEKEREGTGVAIKESEGKQGEGRECRR